MQFGEPHTRRYQFEVFADYHQIYLEDSAGGMPWGDGASERANEIEEVVSTVLSPDALARHLGVAPGVLCIVTARNTVVPLVVEVCDAPPRDKFGAWDHVVEASLTVTSDSVVVSGGAGMFECEPVISVEPGAYRARVYFGSVHALRNNGLEGDDHYRVVLWPAPASAPAVLYSTGTNW